MVKTKGLRLLRQYMRKNGLTQRALAAIVGRSEPSVSMWLTPETRPDLDAAFSMEDAIGIPARAWVRPRMRKAA